VSYDNLRARHEEQRRQVLRALDKAHSDELALNRMVDDLGAERDQLRADLATATARAEAAEAKVVAASDLVYELIGELCDATGRTRAEVEADFLGEVQP
jgi:hypothetical protein